MQSNFVAMKKFKSNLLKIMMGVLGLTVFTSCYGTPRPMDLDFPDQPVEVEEVADLQETDSVQEEAVVEDANQ